MKMTAFGMVLLSLIAGPAFGAPKVLVLKGAGLPITAFNLTFRVGSADDPRGFEGLAHLTAAMIREGGVKEWGAMPARSRAQIEDDLFPLAADIGVQVAKEQISFQVTAPAADARKVFDALAQLVLAPAFNAEEFARIRAESIETLKKQLPREDEEELGKAALERAIYGAGHPYAHVAVGTLHGLEMITLEKIKEFYRKKFTQKRLTVGIAGVADPSLLKRVKTVFSTLPEGIDIAGHDRAEVPAAGVRTRLHLTLVKGPFDAIGAHIGQPLTVNRGSGLSFDQLYLASLGFGKHRSFVGRLMNVVREVRGLNYGTFSYVEEFPFGGHRLSEPTQVARQRQSFTVWARPTTLPNGCFLLRQIHREVKSLAESGLSPQEFELARSHLIGNAPLLGAGLERRLGYEIDSAFYGIKQDYLKRLQKDAKSADHATVNALLKKTLKPAQMDLVVVTPDPARFKERIMSARCDIQYGEGIQKSKDVIAEDGKIATYSLGLQPEDISELDADTVFAN